MTLEILKNADKRTANGILAAAALTVSPDPGVGERPAILKEFGDEANELLLQVRGQLRLAEDDHSPAANAAMESFLAKQLATSIFEGVDKDRLFTRVGQAGQLPPLSYHVIQPAGFRKTF